MNPIKTKKYIPFIIIAVVVILLTVGFIVWENNSIKTETVDENVVENIDDSASTAPSDTDENVVSEEEQVPEAYTNILADARTKVGEDKYTEAIALANQALKIYQNEQAYFVMYSAYSFLNDTQGKKIALKEIVETYSILDARYWIEYADILWQTGAPSSKIETLYANGLEKMKLIAKGGEGHIIDMHTAYARYLVGTEQYAKAIVELQKALALDPTRADIYNAEIATLQAKL